MKPERREVALALRQLATLARLGYPLSEGMKSMGSPWLEEAAQNLERGDTLDQALARQPRLFSPVFTGLLEAARGHERPDQVLDHLSHWLDRCEDTERRLAGALLYPMVVLVGLLAWAALACLFVVPDVFVPFLHELGYLGQGTALIVLSKGAAVLLFLLAGLLSVALLRNRPLWPLLGWLPTPRRLRFQANQALWARALGSLLAADVPVPEALDRSLPIVTDPRLRLLLQPLSERVRRGDSLAASLGPAPELESQLRWSLQSQTPAPRLLYAADRLEADAQLDTRVQLDLLGPRALLAVGLLSALALLAFWWPFYALSNQLGG